MPAKPDKTCFSLFLKTPCHFQQTFRFHQFIIILPGIAVVEKKDIRIVGLEPGQKVQKELLTLFRRPYFFILAVYFPGPEVSG